MTAAALISLAALSLLLGGGLVWAIRAALDRADRAAVAQVGQAVIGADLRVSEANCESLRRALQRKDIIARAHLEVANAVRSDPVLSDASAHGMDRLLAALDAVGAIVPLPDGGAGPRRLGDRLLAPDWGPAEPDADGPRPAPVQGRDGAADAG